MQQQAIQYLRHHQIEKQKWDRCIEAAPNGLIYAYSFYLDEMASNWDALVLNDYEVVMPLPWRKKFGIHYIYQPAFTAQLGVFGEKLDAQLFTGFLKTIPRKFSYWDFSLNHQNNFSIPSIPFLMRVNYILDLSKPYEAIYNKYRENIRRNIRKAISYNCAVQKDVEVTDIIQLAQKQPHATSGDDFESFKKLFLVLKEKNLAKTYAVLSDKGELLASAVFTFSHNRAYYILVGNHPNGRTLGASHALIDAFIKDHAGQNLLLDFEGSDIRNLAFFYSSFGSLEEQYPAIKRNKLPWYVRWMKE